jgi:hypothetical protein
MLLVESSFMEVAQDATKMKRTDPLKHFLGWCGPGGLESNASATCSGTRKQRRMK